MPSGDYKLKKFNNKIVNLRAIAILLVVFGHSIIIFDTNWGIYFPLHESDFFMILKHYISIIQMPFFFSISGFCFYYTVQSKRKIGEFILNKFKRLIIPFILVAALWMIPIRIFAKYPKWLDMSYLDMLLQVLTGKDAGHLWYLGALFIIFIMAYLFIAVLNKMKLENKVIEIFCLLCLLLLSLVSSKLPGQLFLASSVKYLFWFFLGFEINKNSEYLDVFPKSMYILGSMIAVVVISFCVFGAVGNHVVNAVAKYLGTGMIVVSSYKLITDRSIPVMKKIAKNSFGVYLFHSPMLYPVFNYMNWLNPVVMVLFDFIVLYIVAYFLTNILRMNKYSKIILGE